jgi:hypothetical protein
VVEKVCLVGWWGGRAGLLESGAENAALLYYLLYAHSRLMKTLRRLDRDSGGPYQDRETVKNSCHLNGKYWK